MKEVAGCGCAVVTIIVGVVAACTTLIEFDKERQIEKSLTSACAIDPALGTTHTYKTERPDGGNFPHAILQTPSKKALPFIVFHNSSKAIHVFQDTNKNEIVDDKEVVHAFATPEQARQFLTEQVQNINKITE